MGNQTQQLCGTYVRDSLATHGHAMPIALGILRYKSGIVVFDSLFCDLAHGSRVPISWGSPPTNSD